jgi:hypothetical protein
MGTTAAPNRPRRRSPQPRVSVRAPEGNGAAGHENEYDLLTAALIGITIGAGVTYMLRRGPSGRRPVSPVVSGIGRGATWAGRHAARLSGAGARWAAHQGEELWDRVPRDEIREHVSDYMGRAREAIDDVVESELNDLRKAIRRQRKRLGV